MGRHKYIPQFFCLDCGTEIFRQKRGSCKQFCDSCAAERKKTYHINYRRRPEVQARKNEYLRIRYNTDPIFRARKIQVMQAWRDRQKLKVETDQLKGTSEI